MRLLGQFLLNLGPTPGDLLFSGVSVVEPPAPVAVGGAGFGMQAPRVRRPKRRRELVHDDVAIATALLLMFGD